MARWSPFDVVADRRLVHGLHEGDEHALSDLWDAYAERLFDYVTSLVGEGRVAADITHDTFIDACRRAPRMRGAGRLGAWLYGAARRRCLQRDRTRDPAFGGDDAAPLCAALAAVDPYDREIVLLTGRHGLRPADVATVTGLGVRRVKVRGERAARRFADAVAAERSGEPSGEDGKGLAPLAAIPAPVVPAALRHRFMHTATDPELAGHRADIAARGGALSPDGMPNQPDVPSPYTRRWLFAGGGMAGALVSAVVAALIMGPGLGDPTTYWPPGQPKPRPSTGDSPGGLAGGTPRAPGGGSQQPGGHPPMSPQIDATKPPGVAPTAPSVPSPGRPGETGSPQPSERPWTSPPPPGTLVVQPAKVELFGKKTAQIRISADGGPVRWQGSASSDQVTLSPASGTLGAGDVGDLTVNLATGLLNLPGKATVTLRDERGFARQVQIVWGISLL
ncbi:RNA polymerase sigma factor [Actinomadura flavalba]|uniref:RNA polymerase sigma factor n=1 Tax=Actinomadura flavalba TaxID=1120938 RepID=UPI0003617390|nr:RNA polymerase sigma factor [Actinomadura flavalba]